MSAWLGLLKGMGSHLAESWRKGNAYWRAAHPVLWVIEIIYLISLVAVLYFVVTYTTTILEGGAEPLKNTFDWWWIMMTPITQVGTIFLWFWAFGGAVKHLIIKPFNIPIPKSDGSELKE